MNSTYTFAYSDIQGGQAGIVTNNSVTSTGKPGISIVTRSSTTHNADFTLQENSPAVDAGTAYFEWNGNVLVDLSPSEYNSTAPDMGAFESSYSWRWRKQSGSCSSCSANPENGNAPLTVQFSSDGSSDPDGTITLTPGTLTTATSPSEANPSHTYTDAGTYNAVLTVADDQGATGSATVTIDVAQVSQNELHVQAQSVTRQQINRRNWRGVDVYLDY